ncbi:MAG: hypothetical protein B5M48_03505, partial [Candidatus Omnitrophica bacterium 4484_213]
QKLEEEKQRIEARRKRIEERKRKIEEKKQRIIKEKKRRAEAARKAEEERLAERRARRERLMKAKTEEKVKEVIPFKKVKEVIPFISVDDERMEINQHYRQGREYFQQKKFMKAIIEFEFVRSKINENHPYFIPSSIYIEEAKEALGYE